MPTPHQSSGNSRRQFLRTMGRLAITIPFLPACNPEDPLAPRVATTLEELPGSLRRSPQVNAWLELLANGRVRIFSGKVELGQGIRVAIQQVAAEELYLDLDRVEIVLAETGRTPDEGYTAGSGSIQSSAMAVRYAAAAAREKLLTLAAEKLQVEPAKLQLDNGFVAGSRQRLSFAEVLDGRQIEDEVPKELLLKPKSAYRYVGKALPRRDTAQVVIGEPMYVQDLRFPDMVYARVLRPKNYESELQQFDEAAFRREAPGVLQIVRRGSFLGVITERAHQAERAKVLLEKYAQWSRPAIFPPQAELPAALKARAAAPEVVHGAELIIDRASAVHNLQAGYFKPYTMHASVGPACAVGLYDGEVLHIWSHSQGIYPMRRALAAMLALEEERIHVIGTPGAGCFGHTVADDAAADAAVLAMAYPGKHIQVQWSRTDEHRWEPYGSAMIVELEAGLDETGKITYWRSQVWTDSHSTRPNNEAGTLLTARYLDPPRPLSGRGYLAGGHRNADPYYKIPQMQVLAHYFDGPLRVSSLRSLGAFANIFAIESFMDELAERAGQDAVDFRLNHLEDERARAVLLRVQEMISGVSTEPNEGLGIAFCRYKNHAAYCAMAAQVQVEPSSGSVRLLKVWAAVDVGEVINREGIAKQVEGAIVQAASWTLHEAVQFSPHEITSIDWATYPTLPGSNHPEIEIALIDRPEEAALGGGEVGTPPVAAAICNAIYRASGRRVYELPVGFGSAQPTETG